jgi:hypothetical protein
MVASLAAPVAEVLQRKPVPLAILPNAPAKKPAPPPARSTDVTPSETSNAPSASRKNGASGPVSKQCDEWTVTTASLLPAASHKFQIP